ncbi:MAG TPA: toxin-antitoxin system toxin subunit [Planctomycetes bacterium]|nr:toxin-antitoxin system toxin subunit [Planctomycetota bacterium]
MVTARRDGNRLYYAASRAHPLYAELRGLVCKTTGAVEALKAALASANVVCAFVFGSTARGTENARSDIDLMVIGDISLRELTRMLSGLSERIGREVNPHVVTAAELRRRLKQRDHFLTSVLKEPHVMVVGDGRELAALAG